MQQQKITPFLWFDTQAEEAARFYTSIFKDSKLREITRYPEGSPGPVGTVMTISFELEGQEFTALNGGPEFKFSLATSFVVHCDSQEEVDYYWEKLSEGGEKSWCGWLKDKFGLSWQITPDALTEMYVKGDPEKAQRAMKAMMQMQKLDIAVLKRAYDGE
jgi:predicted 3-demethylubiquinone-9 3-methyltransferase (glyoxalase superfamily)